MKKFFSLVLLISLLGCAETAYQTGSKQYQSVKNFISLGDSLNDVLAILEPAQADMNPDWLRSASQYMDGGTSMYIHFQRTGRTPDGLVTDDEFTPYIFANRKLVAIGWETIGGVQSRGEQRLPEPESEWRRDTTTVCTQVGNNIICQ